MNSQNICSSHIRYGMFIKCNDNLKDDHYHCPCCGIKLQNNYILKRMIKKSNIYSGKYICNKLTDHLH